MANIEKKLLLLGLTLPPPVKPPAGVLLPFQFVRIAGSRAYISGPSESLDVTLTSSKGTQPQG
jgi:hypothetical protein